MNIDWAGIALERAIGMSLNDYLQKHVLQPLGIKEVTMFPNYDMRSRLAYMHSRSPDGTLLPKNHLLRAPLVANWDDKAEVAGIFNSGGAGMFAKPQDYCSKSLPMQPLFLLKPSNSSN